MDNRDSEQKEVANNRNTSQVDENILFQKAIACLQKGQLTEAEKLAQRILGTRVDHADTHHLLGVIAGQREQYNLAIKQFSIAIRSNPSKPIYHLHLGLALHKSGNLKDGVKAFERAVKLKPQYAEAYYNLGNTLKDLGQLEKALTACEMAIQANPRYIDALNNRGVIL